MSVYHIKERYNAKGDYFVWVYQDGFNSPIDHYYDQAKVGDIKKQERIRTRAIREYQDLVEEAKPDYGWRDIEL